MRRIVSAYFYEVLYNTALMYQWYKHPLILLILSALLTAAVLPYTSMPRAGLALFFLFFSVVLYAYQPAARGLSSVAMVLSVLLAVRGEVSVVVLTITVLLLLLSYIAASPSPTTLLATLFQPFILLRSYFSLDEKLAAYTARLPRKVTGKGRTVSGDHLLVSWVISFILLIIIIPLLASANPIFARAVESFFEWFRFEWLVVPFPFWIVRGLLFLALLALVPNIPRLLSAHNDDSTRQWVPIIDLSIPQLLAAGVLAIFLVTQVKLYTAGTDALVAMGYSHSSLTREVFGQLTIVALIIFVLLYYGKRTTGLLRFVVPVLLIETVLLILVALKSDLDYIFTWGFTFKRLYGVVFVVWLSGAYWLLARYLHTAKEQGAAFMRGLAWLTVSAVLFVNVVNFDFLIARYERSTTQEGTDYAYLAGLSPDSLSYHLLVPELVEEADRLLSESEDTDELWEHEYALKRLSRRVAHLEERYGEKKDIRTVFPL